MLQTAHGSLFRSLKIKPGDSILIRGGTTSIGLAAAALAKKAGAVVIATTRKSDEKTAGMLRDNGADHVVIDDGKSVKKSVQDITSFGVDKVLELGGGTTLIDSMSCLKTDGVCCLVGLVGGSSTITDFNPLAVIQTQRYLTAYGERSFTPDNLPLDSLVQQIKDGSLKIRVGKLFQMDQIVEAHIYMESNESCGKIVVLTGM